MSGFWNRISDDDLLKANLTTDDPLSTPGLVGYLPEGSDEPHVEASYDLNGTGAEQFKCVHGSHRHLKGYVFRKGDSRYLVGWQCGDKIYGEKFDEYTRRHEQAISEQTTLRRVRDLRNALIEFLAWSQRPEWSPALAFYADLADTIRRHLPFVYSTINDAAGHKIGNVDLPRYLCASPLNWDDRNLKSGIGEVWEKMVIDAYGVQALLNKPNKAAMLLIGRIVEELQGVARRTDIILKKLEDVETFFHPSVLGLICDLAERAEPRRARHFAGLNKLSSKNITVQMPIDYKVPSRLGLEQLSRAITS